MGQVTKLVWRENEVPEELLNLLRTVEEEYAVSDFGRGLKLKFRRVQAAGTVSRVIRSRGEVLVEYNSISAAARGIGSALAGISGDETTPFKTLGIMLDVSRGMVMTVEHLKMWFRRLALSGYNMVMLYAEDVFELPGEPFFGRLRGVYSVDEIKELDSYAQSLGIELIGCIETLGHLEQILRWNGAYGSITDTRSVVLVDEKKTYDLIEKMIAFWSEALGTRRIHLGMDETHDLGRGRFLDQFGYQNPFDLFNRHLGKVNQLCEKHGLKAMIWSDMYFRLGNPERDYYNWKSEIPEAVRNQIPKNVQLVYWDYYHEDPSVYENMLRRHRELGYEPLMGSGIWTWGKLWYDHQQTMRTVLPCISVCRKMKIQEFFFTMWGDDGAYCNYDSALAGIVRCADLAYGVPEKEEKATRARFEAVCMSDYEAHIVGAQLYQRLLPTEDAPSASLLIWDDPLLGIYFDECVKRQGEDFALKMIDRCEEMLCKLLPYQEEAAAGNFEHLTNILDLLGKKLEVESALLTAYRHNDRIALRQIAASLIPSVIAAVQEFDSSFRAQWLDCAKPFGLELIQGRNATLISRLEEAALRIREYLDDQIDHIDELEARDDNNIKNSFFGYGQIIGSNTNR